MASVSSLGTVLVLQHIDCEPPAHYEDILLERGYDIDRIELDAGEALPDSVDYAAMVVMGGPMGALDDAEFSWLAPERDFILRALEADVPYWGVCLGAQLLAAALGQRVYRGDSPEVGTYPLELTADASLDPVFRGLPRVFDVFQWHSDTFDLPEDATLLAGSDRFAHQAFALGSAYGIQFHVEVTSELAEEWGAVPSYRDALESIHGPGAAPTILGELQDNLDHNLRVARIMFEGWLDAFVQVEEEP